MRRAFTIGLAALAACGALAFGASREAQWKRVESAARKGLPKTAIATLDSIAAAALREGKSAEAIRAIVQRISFEGDIQGGRAEEKIRRLHSEIAKAPAEMRPLMEAVLAHWYWQYFRQNRWRFLQRTQTAQPAGDDFTTWDLPRLYREIDLHFRLALGADELLKRTPVSEYEELLVRGTVPDRYRPTLYDFIAFEALEFYSSGEQAGAHPEDAFRLEADSPVFEPAESFVRWRIASTDSTSPLVRAVALYQELLRFHRDDDDPSARIDADLWRLVFARNQAVGDGTPGRFRQAMTRLAERYEDHELSARALYEVARSHHDEGDWAAARQVALRGARRFPDSIGGQLCAELIDAIEERGFAVDTERVWSRPGTPIDVNYRNLDRIHFRLYRLSLTRWLQRPLYRLEHLDERELDSLLASAPVRAWSERLEQTTDFKGRTERLASPEGLSPGVYYLVASSTPRSDRKSGVVHAQFVWVSRLGLVERGGPGGMDGFVLDAQSGEPLAGAEVELRRFQHRRNGYLPAQKATTGVDGRFRFKDSAPEGGLLIARHAGQVLAARSDMGAYHEGPRPVQRQTLFFTDRSIYRPGQTIHYKGLVIEVDTERDRYAVMSQHTVEVAFVDPNGKDIATRSHRTNDYGSFSGTFEAPSGRLLGSLSIVVRSGSHGSAVVRVEEYKRPKFAVELDAPRDPAKLEESIVVEGRATAYTEAPVDGARVTWRVSRAVRYPDWWLWRYGGSFPHPGVAQEIAHGTGETDAEGRFRVRFTARPDPAVKREAQPVFVYSVRADVTDPSGETRSSERSIRVGYTALGASLSAEPWQVTDRPVAIAVRLTSLDDEPRPASGELVVRRLRAPGHLSAPKDDERAPERGPRRRFETESSTGPRPGFEESAWADGEVVFRSAVRTDTSGVDTIRTRLEAGVYRATFEGRDPFGSPVSSELIVRVVDPAAERLAIPVADLLVAPRWEVEPGEEFVALWGTGYERARAFVEIEHRGRVLQAYWTDPARTQHLIRQSVTESMRGGFMLRVTMVRENRIHIHSRRIDVPWSNMRLAVRWEHFTSKLVPGGKETWTAVVTGPDATRAAAEMVATLYDASLDAFQPHGWPSSIPLSWSESAERSTRFTNGPISLYHVAGSWPRTSRSTQMTYRHFAPGLVDSPYGMRASSRDEGAMNGALRRGLGVLREFAAMKVQSGIAAPSLARGGDAGMADVAQESPQPTPPPADLDQVVARRHLQETAFFFPHLRTGQNGEIRLEFTVPEALTRWRFLGFAHDPDLRAGLLEGSAVTSKDLMVHPNPPRFLREGDVLDFTVKVTNRAAVRQKGRVRLRLSDAITGRPADAAVGNSRPEIELDVPAGESRTFAWRLTVPDGMEALAYETVAATASLSDGEEGAVPVLSRRVLVTESLPLPIRGPGTRAFDFARLRELSQSPSLRHQSLTVQMVSNPAWYAVMALPYLIEYPYDCSEQVFNRFYANALARHIARSDAVIARTFERWRGTSALDSPLEKNEAIKAVVLEETPWVRQAASASQARRNVGVLFESRRMEAEADRALDRLAQMQHDDGSWPWFPGGRADDYITLYIVTGFGRMRHLGVQVPLDLPLRALDRLDAWSVERFQAVVDKKNPGANHLTPTIALYLYGRSFYLKERQVPAGAQPALDYWLGQARRHWLELPRQSQAHLALALQRFGELKLAQQIVRSLRERAVTSEELGMFWRDAELSWWWHRAPIESQAMMIEAFGEVLEDSASVEACRVWLLKQKQTQDWKTTKATADAVYALLLRGGSLLRSRALVEVRLNDRLIEPESVEAGTGFYERRIPVTDITPDLARVSVRKTDRGVAWGSVHWQYLEDMGKVTAHEGTPLRLKKTLFIRENSRQGPRLEAVNGPLRVGQEVVVRVELRTDRDMEYVHLKDYRGSGLEPVDVLSGYRYQDGLAYYAMTRDVASHFFIDYLPKGTYVFEYATRVQHAGRYDSGVAQIQCMYAPEFNSHSESVRLEVR